MSGVTTGAKTRSYPHFLLPMILSRLYVQLRHATFIPESEQLFLKTPLFFGQPPSGSNGSLGLTTELHGSRVWNGTGSATSGRAN